jgi:hypothetical protein
VAQGNPPAIRTSEFLTSNSPAESETPLPPQRTKKPRLRINFAAGVSCKVEDRGLEPLTFWLPAIGYLTVSLSNKGLTTSQPPACPTACPDDWRDMTRVVAAWPTLPAPIKAAILALIQASG